MQTVFKVAYPVVHFHSLRVPKWYLFDAMNNFISQETFFISVRSQYCQQKSEDHPMFVFISRFKIGLEKKFSWNFLKIFRIN